MHRNPLKALAIIAFSSIFYFLILNHWVVKEFNDLFYDGLLRFRGSKKDSSIVIVAIDDKSLEKYGHWPWPRSLLAKGIDKIRDERLLAIDLLFAEPSNPADDNALVEAIKRHDRVVLAIGFQRRPIMPILPLVLVAKGMGHVIVAPSMDGVIRRIYTLQKDPQSGRMVWSFPIEVARIYHNIPVDSIIVEKLRIQIGDSISIPVLTDGTYYINYLGGDNSFPVVSFSDVLEGKVASDVFKDKIVFIGNKAIGLGDQYITPFSKGRNPMSGVEVLAHATATLLRKETIKPLEGWKIFFVTLVMLFLVALMSEYEGYTVSFYLFLFTEAVILGAAAFAFLLWRAFFPVSAPMFTLVLAFVSGLLVRLHELTVTLRRMVKEVSQEPVLLLSRLPEDMGFFEENIKVMLDAEAVRIGKAPIPSDIREHSDEWSFREENGFWMAVKPKLSGERMNYFESEIFPMFLRMVKEEKPPGEFLFKGLEQSVVDLAFLQHRIGTENEIFNMLLDAIDGGIVVTDPIGRIQFCNANFSKIFGLPKEEIAGKSIFKILENRPDIKIDIDFREVLFKGLKHVSGNLENTSTNEVYAVAASAIRRVAGRGGLAVILYDITQLRDLIESREFALHGLTHQFTTPIMLIKEYAKLVKENPGQASEFLDFIIKSTEDIQNMIEKFVMLSKLDTKAARESFTSVDVRDLVSAAVEQLRTRYPGKKLSVKLPEKPLLAAGNKDMLNVAVENLLDNALKYGKSEAQIRAFKKNSTVRIEVMDDGRGVPEDEREVIFDKFRRGAKLTKRKGFGLGLALVKRIVEVHYGKIWVEDSQELGGAKFVIELPALEG